MNSRSISLNSYINDKLSLLMSFKYNKKNNSFLTLRTTVTLFLDHLIDDEPQLEIEQSITIKTKPVNLMWTNEFKNLIETN